MAAETVTPEQENRKRASEAVRDAPIQTPEEVAQDEFLKQQGDEVLSQLRTPPPSQEKQRERLKSITDQPPLPASFGTSPSTLEQPQNDPSATTRQLNGQREEARRARALAGEASSNTEETEQGTEKELSFRRAAGFAMLGLIFDICVALLTLLYGVGYFVAILMTPVMYALYWVFIWRFIPADFRGRVPWDWNSKANKRVIYNLCVKMLPVIGQLWPAWTIAPLDAYRLTLKHKAQQAKEKSEEPSKKEAKKEE